METEQKDKPAEAQAPPAAPARLCAIADVLTPQTLRMIGACPTNEVARTLVLAAIRKPIPDEAKTFKQIKDWIETNVSPVAKVESVKGIEVTVRTWERVSGHCTYTEERSGEGTHTLTPEDINDCIQQVLNEECGVETLMRRLGTIAEEKASEDPAETDDDPNTIEYYNYEDTDTLDTDHTVVHSTAFKDAVLAFLRSNHPEDLDELSNNSDE